MSRRRGCAARDCSGSSCARFCPTPCRRWLRSSACASASRSCSLRRSASSAWACSRQTPIGAAWCRKAHSPSLPASPRRFIRRRPSRCSPSASTWWWIGCCRCIRGPRERTHEGGMAPVKPKAEGRILDVRNLRIEAVTETGMRVTLVDVVSFTLNAGEVLGLIGESGAGKSTIGLSTMVYARTGCQITAGQILFQGRDLRELDIRGRQDLRGVKVAYIAQSAAAAFNPAHTIFDQVAEVALQHGVMNRAHARMDAIRLFRELELPNPDGFGHRYLHQVSGGQLQRAMAAMAMIAKPDLLVFDEPTTALDVTTQVEVLASFKKLIREHRTAALYITHDLAVVAQIANRIMVLRGGKMVEEGAATQILQSPQMDYTRLLVAERVAAEQSRFVE